ncbi:MAG TPA: LysE family translocator [Pseudonocardiaceae bacterium]|nr:LysE family translocator [Pseudonocardiaceae bacterium]
MRSLTEFLVIAVVVTFTPGPGTANVLRVAARDGRRAALSAIVGNAGGVLMWGVLSAFGVSSLILASRIAYDVLRIGGAVVLIAMGLRVLWQRRRGIEESGSARKPVVESGSARMPVVESGSARKPTTGLWSGLVTSVSNPKLAVFFVALFPQFVTPGSPVLPYALAMAGFIVVLDVLWFSTLAFAVERATTLFRPKVRLAMERFTGLVMVGLGIRLATEAR